MQLLLDTHVFVWLVNNNPLLGKKTHLQTSSTRNKLYLSFISLFEMTIKASLGKLAFDPSIANDLAAMSIDLLGTDTKTLVSYQIFNQNNKDPFDDYLIGTALTHKLTLVTADEKILATSHPNLHLFDARD